ncbi:unnamed protein product [Thelazia callipaeda]|uniref:Pepsin-I3 domain-containing protein n=1 Tax=Thelazia callipaeda TaxID=103827 RepID=A0A0N5D604_THECL|nr:unnamed protein product [Thelazia callipaeda]
MHSCMFRITLLTITAVLCVQAFSVKSSTYLAADITFNNTVCSVKDGALTINGVEMGNLTEAERQELLNYIDETAKITASIKAAIESAIAAIKGTFDNWWESDSNMASSSNEQTEAGNDEKLESGGNWEMLGRIRPPSFCYKNYAAKNDMLSVV